MKYLAALLFSLVLIGMAGSALAKGPKNDIMHCGCVYVADEGSLTTGTASMIWKQLSIKNGKGHSNHVVGHEDSCLSGFEPIYCTEDDVFNLVEGCESIEDIKGYDPLFTDFTRGYDDCLIDGNMNFLDYCDDSETEEDETPVPGDDCTLELD